MANENRKLGELVKSLKTGRLLPTSLNRGEQARVALFLDVKGISRVKIGALLRLSGKTVRRRLKQAQREVGREYQDIDISVWIGEVMESATHSYNNLIKVGKYYTAWRVIREKIEILQKMGVVPIQSIDVNVQHTIAREFEELDAKLKEEITDAEQRGILQIPEETGGTIDEQKQEIGQIISPVNSGVKERG